LSVAIVAPAIRKASKMLFNLGDGQPAPLGGPGLRVSAAGQQPKDDRNLSQYLIEGRHRAQQRERAAGHFWSAMAVLRASAADLCTAPGVGKKTALPIRETLDFAADGRVDQAGA